MARAFWKATISFGLINVPVTLYSAVRRKRVGFHLLHRKDKARLRRKFTRTSSTQEVPCEETVRGYETIPDRLVIVEEQGLAALAPKSRRTIELVGFAARDAIDPIYFDRPYYWKRCSTLPRLSLQPYSMDCRNPHHSIQTHSRWPSSSFKRWPLNFILNSIITSIGRL